MEGKVSSGALENAVIFVIIAAIWLAMTWAVLKSLPRMRGWMRIATFILGTLMAASVAGPAWFYIMLILFSLGSHGPEGPMGIGGPAIIAGINLGIITGLVVSTIAVRRRATEGRPS